MSKEYTLNDIYDELRRELPSDTTTKELITKPNIDLLNPEKNFRVFLQNNDLKMPEDQVNQLCELIFGDERKFVIGWPYDKILELLKKWEFSEYGKKIMIPLQLAINKINQLQTLEANKPADVLHKNLSKYEESKKILKEKGIDLDQIINNDVRDMIRWGIISHEDSKDYVDGFNNLQISKEEIEGLDLSKQFIVLGIDNLTLQDAYDLYLENSGIKCISTMPSELYFSQKKIDMKSLEQLEDQNPTGQSGILFAPNFRTLPEELRHTSPNFLRNNMKNGQKYLGPIGFMKLLRRLLDDGLSKNYPDIDIYSLSSEDYKNLIKKSNNINYGMDLYWFGIDSGIYFPSYRSEYHSNSAPYFSSYSFLEKKNYVNEYLSTDIQARTIMLSSGDNDGEYHDNFFGGLPIKGNYIV